MILSSNFVHRLNTSKSFIWRQNIDIMALCSHFVTASAFFNSFCWFPTNIKRSSGPGFFQDILFTFLFHERFLWDWNQFFFSGLLQYSLFFPTKGEKNLVLGCGSYIGSPSTMPKQRQNIVAVPVLRWKFELTVVFIYAPGAGEGRNIIWRQGYKCTLKRNHFYCYIQKNFSGHFCFWYYFLY